jgi:ribosome-associated protein
LTQKSTLQKAKPALTKATAKGLTRSSKFFKTIINAIDQKKGDQITSLDLKKIPEAVADLFVVCVANSTTQIKAIGDYIEKTVIEEFGEKPYRKEGYQAAQWILIDYIDIVVHIMHPETRAFYKLEEMWSDADIKEHF